MQVIKTSTTKDFMRSVIVHPTWRHSHIRIRAMPRWLAAKASSWSFASPLCRISFFESIELMQRVDLVDVSAVLVTTGCAIAQRACNPLSAQHVTDERRSLHPSTPAIERDFRSIKIYLRHHHRITSKLSAICSGMIVSGQSFRAGTSRRGAMIATR